MEQYSRHNITRAMHIHSWLKENESDNSLLYGLLGGHSCPLWTLLALLLLHLTYITLLLVVSKFGDVDSILVVLIA